MVNLTDQWSCYTCGYLGFSGEDETGEPCCQVAASGICRSGAFQWIAKPP